MKTYTFEGKREEGRWGRREGGRKKDGEGEREGERKGVGKDIRIQTFQRREPTPDPPENYQTSPCKVEQTEKSYQKIKKMSSLKRAYHREHPQQGSYYKRERRERKRLGVLLICILIQFKRTFV